MKHLTFNITIHAPREVVWSTMLDPQSYREWTKPFMEGSYFEGSWDEGCTIRFLAPNGEGMVAMIARNEPHAFISIKHLGFTANGKDDTTSDAVTAWAPAYENYRFEAVGGGTQLTIEQDMQEEHAAMIEAVWPKALAALKALCEK
ncbi:SRPBCC family protein [Hydrogenophaga sp. BPS33]|uniref:SRPBCC family protein n=1 Tax=Hydrogenophaga sp. BPS33 TaxID=2651974 RepID=UPI00131FCAAB|nr:SRPBCC domain-containing protein [Hydrogenophaga sp. BPS33]QHE87044.1 SRPBCC domain-containing protein [Hydrogenophaga sp. BPS33]